MELQKIKRSTISKYFSNQFTHNFTSSSIGEIIYNKIRPIDDFLSIISLSGNKNNSKRVIVNSVDNLMLKTDYFENLYNCFMLNVVDAISKAIKKLNENDICITNMSIMELYSFKEYQNMIPEEELERISNINISNIIDIHLECITNYDSDQIYDILNDSDIIVYDNILCNISFEANANIESSYQDIINNKDSDFTINLLNIKKFTSFIVNNFNEILYVPKKINIIFESKKVLSVSLKDNNQLINSIDKIHKMIELKHYVYRDIINFIFDYAVIEDINDVFKYCNGINSNIKMTDISVFSFTYDSSFSNLEIIPNISTSENCVGYLVLNKKNVTLPINPITEKPYSSLTVIA